MHQLNQNKSRERGEVNVCFLFQAGSKFNNIDKNQILNVKQELLKNSKPLFISNWGSQRKQKTCQEMSWPFWRTETPCLWPLGNCRKSGLPWWGAAWRSHCNLASIRILSRHSQLHQIPVYCDNIHKTENKPTRAPEFTGKKIRVSTWTLEICSGCGGGVGEWRVGEWGLGGNGWPSKTESSKQREGKSSCHNYQHCK